MALEKRKKNMDKKDVNKDTAKEVEEVTHESSQLFAWKREKVKQRR